MTNLEKLRKENDKLLEDILNKTKQINQEIAEINAILGGK